MRRRDRRRRIKVIRYILQKIHSQGLYSCVVAGINNCDLRGDLPPWYDMTWHNDRIVAIRFLRMQGFPVVCEKQWARTPSYFKGKLFFNNTTRLDVYKKEEHK